MSDIPNTKDGQPAFPGAGGSDPIPTTPEGHPIVQIAGDTIVCDKLKIEHTPKGATVERSIESVVRGHIEKWWREGKINHTHTPADADALVADVRYAISLLSGPNSD